MSNIPVPEPLKLGGNVEEAVKQFKLQWKYYALATELSKKGNDLEIATFMAVVGAEAVMMIDDLALTEAQQATPVEPPYWR